MIQSPRGPMEFIAYNSFTSQSPASDDNIDRPNLYTTERNEIT